ncbi:MAG: SPFH domain-containing protein [Anaeromyxobacteraceae bacterium]|nr:SPFH domain-containing protein [Anaeromyxobacteraceae bacterium]
MAQITRYGFLRHLRADASAFVLRYQGGALRSASRGAAFWFLPHDASVAEVPADDQEMPVLFHARTADFQDVAVQGVVTYRVQDPQRLAARIDFSVDLDRGLHLRQPLERLQLLLTQLAEQHAWTLVARAPVREILAEGPERIRQRIEEGFAADAPLAEMGLLVVSVRVGSVRPAPELEKALEAPTREGIQQQADEAAFSRRALAVEKERAIQENELKNQIELTRRQEELIAQRGLNARRQAEEEAAAGQIAAEAKAARGRTESEAEVARRRAQAEVEAHATRVRGEAEAQALDQAEKVRVAAEGARMALHRDVPAPVLYALAAQTFAGKLDRIEHLNLGESTLGPALERLLQAGAARLAGE